MCTTKGAEETTGSPVKFGLWELQNERRSVAYFTMPRRSALVQGPAKKYALITAGELLCSF